MGYATDGSICDWAWVIDLDANVLQAYKGSKGDKASYLAPERNLFAEAGVSQQELRATFKFEELPDQNELILVCGIDEAEGK